MSRSIKSPLLTTKESRELFLELSEAQQRSLRKVNYHLIAALTELQEKECFEHSATAMKELIYALKQSSFIEQEKSSPIDYEEQILEYAFDEAQEIALKGHKKSYDN